MHTLPIIDIAPLYSSDPSAWPAVAEQIDRACRDWGFFYITGHPISPQACLKRSCSAASSAPPRLSTP